MFGSKARAEREAERAEMARLDEHNVQWCERERAKAVGRIREAERELARTDRNAKYVDRAGERAQIRNAQQALADVDYLKGRRGR